VRVAVVNLYLFTADRLILMRECARIARTDPGSNLGRGCWESYDMHLSFIPGPLAVV